MNEHEIKDEIGTVIAMVTLASEINDASLKAALEIFFLEEEPMEQVRTMFFTLVMLTCALEMLAQLSGRELSELLEFLGTRAAQR